MFQGKIGVETEVVHALAARGVLRRPDEEGEEFLCRARQRLRPLGVKRLHSLQQMNGAPLISVSPRLKREGFERLGQQFGWAPWWVPMFAGSSRSPFTGGSMWLLECERTKERFPIVWVSTKRSRWLRPAEVVAHEAVHAVRSPLPESWLEEYYAYSTSSIWWHRYAGLIFGSPWFLFGLSGLFFFFLYQTWLGY